MKSPRKVLAGTLVGVVAIAGAGWYVSTLIRSPADEAALRKAPKPSLITASVERRVLTSTVAVGGTLEFGSPLPVTLAGVVGGMADLQRVTRAPREGKKVKEGAVLMEVNGRPVFVLKGVVPMHRTIGPGVDGDDVKQLQRALRRLGYGGPSSGVFDSATAAAVKRWYAKKDYQAQEPTLTDRQTLDNLRKAVQTAQEMLVTARTDLDKARDVAPLKVRLDNARKDLKTAKSALEDAQARTSTPDDQTRLEAAQATVRAAQATLLEAEQALAAARSQASTAPQATPTSTSTSTPAAAPTPTPTASSDTRLQEMRVANARADLAAARRALSRVQEEARIARAARLEELRKAVRTAREGVVSAEQALRQARQTSPARLKVANAGKDVAAARSLLGEFMRTYGTTVPAGEIVFLPELPARVDKAKVKAGATVTAEVATVTNSSFVVAGSVQTKEGGLLRDGMPATIETSTGKTYPARLSAVGDKAKIRSGQAPTGSEPVLITPTSMKGLSKSLSGATVTAKITVGATKDKVLVVPVAAVVTSTDGQARVRVEIAPDKTKEVEVRTGLVADGNVQVSGDLKEGDRVVIGGA